MQEGWGGGDPTPAMAKLNDISLKTAYYTQPQTVSLTAPSSAKEFWLPQQRLPQMREGDSNASLPALAVKKGGDYPHFWHQDTSFLAVMEELYQRVRTKNKGTF